MIKKNVSVFRARVQQNLQLSPAKTSFQDYVRLTQFLLDSCSSVQNILDDYFVKKDKKLCFSDLQSFLDQHIGDIQAWSSVSLFRKSKPLEKMYRLAKKGPIGRNRKSLFHPPFDVTKKFNLDYRYSNKDFPSLYLGCSLELCLHEVNSTNKNLYYASQFKIHKREAIKVLNFGYRWNEIKLFANADLNDSKKQKMLEAWFTLFPLMLACSIVRISSGKDEYVLPQLLMEYLRYSTILDGIRYYSTKKIYVNAWTKNSINFAFPAKGVKKKGFDNHLVKKFRLTKPIDLSFVKSLADAELILSKKKCGKK